MLGKTSLLAVAIALVVGGAGPARGDSWPAPKEGWWRSLRVGASATYDVTMGTMHTRIVMTVDKVKGSEITLTTRTFMGDEDLGAQSMTVDAKTDPLGGVPLPAGLELERGRTTTLRVGDQAFIATLYTVESDHVKATMWLSKALPPVFAGGAVKLEIDGRVETTMTLVAYDEG